MKNLKPPLIFWATLSLSLLIIAGSIAYYFLWFLPNKEEAKVTTQQTEIKQEAQKTKTREGCLEEAKTKAVEKLQKLYDSGVMTVEQKREWEQVKDTGLAKKEDINWYFDQCLLING